jgi:tetratricopeptide (TPR) repeat protein
LGGRVRGLRVLFIALVLAPLWGCAAGEAVRTERGPVRPVSPAPREPEPVKAELIPEAYGYFTAGNLYAAAGYDSAALASFRKALTYDPASREIRMALADAYLRSGRYDEAAITAESIRTRDPELLQFLVDVYSRMRNLERRLAVFEEWSRVDPDDADVWRYLANAYRTRSDTAGLERAVAALARLAPDPVIFEQLGYMQLERGLRDSAAYSFHRAVALDSTQKATRVLLGLAQIWADREQPDSAYVYYRAAVDRNPQSVELQKRYLFFLLQHDRHDEALALARSLVARTPGDPEVLYRLAILEYGDRRLDSAEAHLTRLVTDFGDDALARLVLGRIALDLGDSVKAEAQYLQSLSVADTLVEAYLALGALYSEQRQFELAIELFRKGLAVLPEQQGLLFGLGAAQERAGKFDSAVATFETLLGRYPDFAPALNYLGYMWADDGVRLEEARGLIEAALKIDPENGAYLDSHAWVLFRLGKTREAAAKMRQAIERIQSDPIVFEHYGDILAELGNLNEAQANWRKALEMDPDNARLREKLAR